MAQNFTSFTPLESAQSPSFSSFTPLDQMALGAEEEKQKKRPVDVPPDIPSVGTMGNVSDFFPEANAQIPSAPDNRSTISLIGDFLRPGFKSVLEAPVTPEQQQLNADRRLGYGVGPISPEAEAAAVAVRAGKEATKNKTVNKVARAMNAQGDPSFSDLVARAKDVERLQEKPETESALSFGEEFVKGAKGAVQYALPSMARQIGLQGSAVAMMDNQKRLDLMDKIDSGVFPTLKELKNDPVYEAMRDNGSNLTLVNNYFANRNTPDVAAKMRGATTKEFQAMATDTRTHIDMLNQYAKENKEKYGPRVEKFTDINWTDPRVVADFTNWLGFNMGSGAVQMAPVMLAAVVAKQPGLLATSGAMGVSEAVGNRMKFLQEQMKGLPPEQQGEAIAKYVADTGDANLITGLVSGSFDLFLGPAAKAAKVGLSKAIGDVGLKAALKTAAKELPKDIGGEAVTGALQETTQIAAKKSLGEEGKRITRENLKDIVNAAAAEGAGAPVGTAVNLGVGAVQNMRATPQPRGRIEPSFQPEASVNQPPLPEPRGRIEPVLQSAPAPAAPSPSDRIEPSLDQAPPIREEVPGMVPESDLDIQEKVTPVTVPRENPNAVPVTQPAPTVGTTEEGAGDIQPPQAAPTPPSAIVPPPTKAAESIPETPTVPSAKTPKLFEPPAEQHAAVDFPTVSVPVADLKLSEDVPQFKAGATDKGVVEPLTGKFSSEGTAPIAVWRRLDGTMEVISGRHRFDLAQRSGTKVINAQVYDEAQGFTAADASILDAELNIRDEQGKVKDYVNYFKSSGTDKQTAESKGLLGRVKGKRGFAIANQGADALITALNGDQIGDEAAYYIALNAPNDDRLQAVGLQAIMDGKSMNTAVNTMQAVKAMAAERDTTTDMFGFDDSLIKEAQEMAKIAAKMQQSIASRLAAISGAAKNPAMAKAEGIDVRDPEAVKVRINELKAQKAALENWSTSPELVAQIRAARGVEAPTFELKSETPEETVARESTQDAERRAAEEKTKVDNEVDFFALQPQTQEKPEAPTVDMFAGEAGPSAEYQAASEIANRASAQFGKVQEAYRKQEIGDDDFLAGRKVYDAAMSEFDAAVAKEQGQAEPTEAENKVAAKIETTTAAQREEAETHAQEVGGTLIWQDGDHALIRGYSLLSGDPVYVPTMGSSRARTDIASFTWKQIPEDVKQTMLEVKQRLEEEAATKHATDPFIVFDRGMAFSPDIPAGLADVARGWKDLLKLKPNIYISTVASAKENKDNFTGPHRRIGSAALDSNSRGSTRRMTDDSHYIVVSKSTSPTLMLEIIAHELGHIHEKAYFNQASPDVKEALKKAHATWVKSQKGRSAQELVDSLRGRATARVMAIDPNAKADNLNPYWTSFGEWYADQVSRWAVTSKSPVSVVEKFFKKLAIQLRSFYQKLRNAKYLPNETFAKYIEEATGKSVDLTPQDDRASQMATGNEDEKSGDVLEVTQTSKRANIEDDKKLIEKHNRPPTPQLDPTPTKTTLVNATKASKEYLKLSFDNPMEALGTAANSIDRGVMYARNKNIWFGSGLNAADFAKYNGQLMTSQGLATASVALDNAIRGSQIATEVIFQGGIRFDPVSLNFVATQKAKGMRGVYEAESELKKKLGNQLGTDIIQGYLEAKRSRSIQNEFYDRQAKLETLKEQYEQMLESDAPEKDIKIAKDAFVDAKTELQDIELVFNKINMSDAEIDEFIARDKVHPELRKIMDNWSAINQNMLTFWRQVGLLSEKRYESLSNIQDYVPWQRIMNDETDIHSPVQATNRTMTNIGLERVFKKGTPTVITDFKATEGQQDFKVQPAKVMQVEVNGKTVDPVNIESLPEGKVRLNVPIAKGDLVVFTASREIENIVDNMTRNVMRMTMNGLRQYAAQRIVAEYATRNAKNQVMTFPKVDLSRGRFSFITNGKRIVVEIQDPLIAESVIGMETLGIAMYKPLAIAANITRRAITLSGAFQIKQIFKDAPTAALVTGVKNPLLLMGGVYKGFVTSLLQTDPTVQILKSAGIGGFQSAARTPEAEIKRRIGIMNRNVFDFMIKGLDHIGDSSDMAQRVAVYKRVLAETGNETQALYQAANVINFLHHGSGQMAQFVVKTVPFAGAYANSIDVLAQALAGGGLKGNSRAKNLQRLAVTGTLLTTMTLLYCMMVGDDDEYNQMDDQTKLRNFMIPGTKIMLPMNTSAAYFFKAIPEMLYNKVIKEGTDNAVDARRLRTALKEAAIDLLLGPTPVPSAVKPVLEIGLNKDFFTGRPVVPDSVAKLDAAERYTAETSELGKRLSALTGTDEKRLLDPIEADHIVRGIFGSAGAMAQWFSNSIGAAAGERVAPTEKQKPFVGPFLRDEVPRRNEDLFYKFKEIVDNKYGTYTKMVEREDLDAADKYLDKNSDLVESHDYITEVGTELKEINSMIRYYGEAKDTGLTPQERRKEIIDLQRLKQEVLDDVIDFRKNAGL